MFCALTLKCFETEDTSKYDSKNIILKLISTMDINILIALAVTFFVVIVAIAIYFKGKQKTGM